MDHTTLRMYEYNGVRAHRQGRFGRDQELTAAANEAFISSSSLVSVSHPGSLLISTSTKYASEQGSQFQFANGVAAPLRKR